MDAMERLAEKNRRHSQLVHQEKVASLKLLPLLLVYLSIYLWGAGYLAGWQDEPGRPELVGLSKQVLLFCCLVFYGLGGVLFAYALSYALCVEWLAKTFNRQIRHFHVLSVSLRRLLMSALSVYTGIWMSDVIRENSRSIASALRFGFDSTPFLLVALGNFILVMVLVFWLLWFFALLYLPANIKATLTDICSDENEKRPL